MQISGEEYQYLNEALVSAFSYRELKQMLQFGMAQDLENITLADSKNAVVFDLIGYYNRRDQVELLVQAARRYQPTNGKLYAVAQSLELATQVTAWLAGEQQVVGAFELEKTVRRNVPMLRPAELREHMAQIEGQMCLIERKEGDRGRARGSGFLVGPDTVLTNWHVVEGFLDGSQAQNLKVRFDATLNTQGLREPGDGIEFDVEEIVVSSPPSAAELTGDMSIAPEANQLDFAILRLFKDAGHSPIGGYVPNQQQRERRWMELPEVDPAFAPGDPLIIYQYPKGHELMMAIDTDAVVGTVWDGLRVRYRNNTKWGSSGSPVLNMAWQLVALHHGGAPGQEPVAFNQGIPIARIAAYAREQGYGDLFGE